jgi:hypothetical protein
MTNDQEFNAYFTKDFIGCKKRKKTEDKSVLIVEACIIQLDVEN